MGAAMTPARDSRGRFLPRREFQGPAVPAPARAVRPSLWWRVRSWFSVNLTGPRGRWCPP